MLRISEVSLKMEGLSVLNNLSIEVENDEIVALVGPSGCGKTTLLNVAAGFILPDRGTVWVGDENVTGVTGRVSYMQQKDLLLPWLTLVENASLPLLVRGEKKKEALKAASELLPDFGLSGFEDYYPAQLSGGMRQRAALLRTYLMGCSVVLLDEPFGGLDAITRLHMQDWLRAALKGFHSSVLLVTHDIDEAMALSDRIHVLSSLPARIAASHPVPPSEEARTLLKKEILQQLRPALS
jgi:ABC-type nitrate/sulfonate/bicarbonate transport system ATPase subunit